MASKYYNFSVKTHLSEFKSNSDTVSEASESGTSNSVTSAEDLQKLAVILGFNSAEDVYQERFRVDRRRLEAMLAENLEESQTAHAFFHRVMSETHTLINWPARLKIGARSKKDPHVRIAGRPDDVKLAREKIMQLLDTRSNRVTMKIDVSYTDHSHIIGKGGLTIKRVMEETGCHIHFPDSNRTSTVEKSNQVSIAGDMERVERARARVRALTPLVFCFELPIVAPSQPLPDINSPYVQQVQEEYNVQVMLRNRPKLHANLLVVKGVQWEVQATMEATSLLMNYMCGPLASQTLVQMSLEISAMHHAVVVGRAAEQLKVIMKGSGTQIMFPDADDPNIPVLKKSCVTITGQIKDVYAARQQLVGSLPLVVIFDVSEEACRIENESVARLMQKYNVYINVRRKPKQGIASIVIKGIERCAGDIYEARRELLGGKESVITAEIPESYNIPAITNTMPNFGVYNPFSPTHANSMTNSPCSPYNIQAQMQEQLSPFGGALSPPLFPGAWLMPDAPRGLYAAAPRPHPHSHPLPHPHSQPHQHPHSQPQPLPHPHPHQPNLLYKAQPSWNQMNSPQEMGGIQQPHMMQPQYQAPPEGRHTTLSQLLNSSSQASSGYQSNFTGSSVSLDTQNISGGDGSNVESPSVSPISKTHSPAPSNTDTDRSQREHCSDVSLSLGGLVGSNASGSSGASGASGASSALGPLGASSASSALGALGASSATSALGALGASATETLDSDMLLSRRAVGCEKKTRSIIAKLSPLSEYRKLKSDANNAMQAEIGLGCRVPTPRWSGYYFSRTSPAPLSLDANNNNVSDEMTTPEKGWSRPHLARPNIELAVSPPTPAAKPCRYQQLYDLLKDIGLHKYIDLFKSHELDLSTFASLNEADLSEIGISAFGARRKMLLVINELQKQQSAFKGGAATNLEQRPNKLIASPPYNPQALPQDKW